MPIKYVLVSSLIQDGNGVQWLLRTFTGVILLANLLMSSVVDKYLLEPLETKTIIITKTIMLNHVTST